jgi:hypothetical protein
LASPKTLCLLHLHSLFLQCAKTNAYRDMTWELHDNRLKLHVQTRMCLLRVGGLFYLMIDFFTSHGRLMTSHEGNEAYGLLSLQKRSLDEMFKECTMKLILSRRKMAFSWRKFNWSSQRPGQTYSTYSNTRDSWIVFFIHIFSV